MNVRGSRSDLRLTFLMFSLSQTNPFNLNNPNTAIVTPS